MAKPSLKVAENVSGNFYVDSTCINCDTCRKFAPANFADARPYSYVSTQPQNESEVLQSQIALLSCPTNSIGTMGRGNLLPARDALPQAIDGGVYINGHNSEDSFGADSYFIQSDKGNWLIDSPRFNADLVNKFHAIGGIKYIFLTHKDDMADSYKYAKEFGAKKIIHTFDAGRMKDAEIILEGDAEHDFDDAKIIFTPGHTRGHMVLLWKGKFLFTGDHFAWLDEKNDFGSFHDACWYDWDIQTASVAKLANLNHVEWVLPGHGNKKQVERGVFAKIIARAVVDMKSRSGRSA